MHTDIKIKAGVIEGFFGKPWDWSARMSCANFLRDGGYQFYIYAPKSDSFLRRRWREPIPEQTLEHLRDLRGHCRQSSIAFGIGLTPFEIYLNYDTGAQALLRSKVLQINEVGPDILCILFDDMRGDEFGLPPKAYLRDLGRIVDPRIDFFWTGEQIISDAYSTEHLAKVAADIGRRPFIWDNYISNDSKTRTNYLFLDPSAGSWDLPINRVAGLAINPMNQAYLSRIALCGYRYLLRRGGKRQAVLPEICRALCGPSVAERLIADIDLLQNVGLAELSAETRSNLFNQYETEKSNPYAHEITAWVSGEYAFDPQCLTD